MRYVIFSFFIIHFCIIQCFGNVEVKLLSYTFDNMEIKNEDLEKEFDEYAENNNLNVKIKFDVIKYEKPTDSYSYFKTLVESLLKKSTSPYDVYYYDSTYLNIYGPYLLNLSDYLPKEHIDMYKIVKEACTYGENEVVGLPTGVSYEILYSNIELLDKYNKTIPKTWDELIDTCKYIMDKENDPELICYNGLFDDSEQGLYSLYEFIYSCRDSYNSTYPTPKDPSFTNALKMLKKLKDEVDSGDVFSSNENFTFNKLLNGKAIFIKYWLIGEPLLSSIPYYKSVLPGLTEGISGTMILGYNIGIAKNLDEVKRNAALEVIKFFTSVEYQKKKFMNGLIITGITDMLNDEEVCAKAHCDIVKNIQFTGIPNFIKNESEYYDKKYKKYIYRFLYENKSIKETLKQISDIKKIYYITLNTENTYIGLICFISFCVISLLMLLSLITLFNDNFNPFFTFLPTDFWIITVLGSILILWTPFINYGPSKALNCYLKPLVLSLGYTLSMCPVLYKLISLFPEDNKISAWVFKHRYIFLIFNCLIDGLLNSISLNESNQNNIKLISVEDGESFKICKYEGENNVIIPIIYKVIVIVLMLFFIFVEWSISTSIYDIRFIVSAVYTDILCIIFLLVFNFIIIKNYKIHFIIHATITSLISIANYIFLFGIRVFLGFIKKQNVKLQFINNINNKFINNETQVNSNVYSNYDNNNNTCKSNTIDDNDIGNTETLSVNKSSNFITRIIDYHYSKESSLASSQNSSTINSR